MNSRSGLTDGDITILRHYVNSKNRELYWNYLAQLPGNDGYGRLALGVVRNDNMPGATANLYAQNYAREHNGKVFSEREWDNFGVDLMKRDFAHREKHASNGQGSLALNLPASAIQEAHDKSFEWMGVDPDAWTPRKLLEASRAAGVRDAEEAQRVAAARGGALSPETIGAITEARVERVWASMLDNGALGLHRGKDTLLSLAEAQVMPVAERAAYAKDMAAAYLGAIDARPHTNANLIGRSDHYYARDRDGEWVEVRHAEPTIGVRHDVLHDVDAATHQRLEDTRDLRQLRAKAREAFHPADPGRHVPSPHPLAETSPRTTFPTGSDDPVYATIRMCLPRGIGDDKVAAMAVRARYAGMRQPEDISSVDVDQGRIACVSRQGRRAELSLHAPSPPKEDSLDLGRKLETQGQEADMQRAVEMHLAMERSMQRSTSFGRSR